MRFVLRSFEAHLVHQSLSVFFFTRILEANASSHLVPMFFSLEGFMFSVQLFFFPIISSFNPQTCRVPM